MSEKNLNILREKIDKIDKDILKLIQKRANIAIKVGDIKIKPVQEKLYTNLKESLPFFVIFLNLMKVLFLMKESELFIKN